MIGRHEFVRGDLILAVWQLARGHYLWTARDAFGVLIAGGQDKTLTETFRHMLAVNPREVWT